MNIEQLPSYMILAAEVGLVCLALMIGLGAIRLLGKIIQWYERRMEAA